MIQTATVIPSFDLAPLDDLLLDPATKRLRPLPAATLRQIPALQLRGWCVKRARYQLITNELVDWLRSRIGGRSAIEVGAGQGDLGAALKIPMSDSGMQQIPDVYLYYRSIGQEPTNPPYDVRRIDALGAIRASRPQVVIAAWLTQAYESGDEQAAIGSSVYGPDERAIVESVQTYIHIGNAATHGDKRILALPHEEYRPPWLVSRAADQSQNVIWVWDKEQA
jgi:hypothetical protein